MLLLGKNWKPTTLWSALRFLFIYLQKPRSKFWLRSHPLESYILFCNTKSGKHHLTVNSWNNLDRTAHVCWPSSSTGTDPDGNFPLHLSTAHSGLLWEEWSKAKPENTQQSENTQGSQILLNKPHLMLINIKAGQNLPWFKLALCSSKTLGKPGRSSDWTTGAGKSVRMCEWLWYHWPWRTARIRAG